jgi:tRNA threonylcarbamoyladenosine biosynthesis protein TsaE
LGIRIAKKLRKGDILALFGNLGSGKTAFVKGIAEGLGIDSRLANSPSFVLVKEYKGRLALYHFDLYRIEDIIDVFNIGFEEYLSRDGVVIIEWADRIKEILPEDYLQINFRFKTENERLLRLIPRGARYNNLIMNI